LKANKPAQSTPQFPQLHKDSRWIVGGFSRRDKQGHRFWYCHCKCQAPDAPWYEIREDHLTSGSSLQCRPCAMASRWGWSIGGARYSGRRQKSAPPPQVPQPARDIVSAAEAPNFFLIGVSAGSVRKCEHGVYLIEADLETGKARYCSICTRPPVITCPVYRPSASKTWELKLKIADLDINRGMSLT
jgi:hypothetical protein